MANEQYWDCLSYPLTQGFYTLIDCDDLKIVQQTKWRIRNAPNRNLYAQATTRIDGKAATISLHRILMGSPKGKDIDHINGNSLDNRRVNLRECTNKQNQGNRHRFGGSSQYKGVHFSKQSRKWRAQIGSRDKRKTVGEYKNEVDAALAYDKAAIEYFGEFANLNFPNALKQHMDKK